MNDNQTNDIEALIAEHREKAQKRRQDAPPPPPPHFHGKLHGRAHKPRKPHLSQTARRWRSIERALLIIPTHKKGN